MICRPDGQPVQPLGLGGTSQTRPQWADRAYRHGIDYFFFYSQSFSGMVEGVKSVCRRHRDGVVVATGSESRDIKSLRRSCEEALSALATPFIDIFYLEYVSPEDSDTAVADALGELADWKTSGTIRYAGASVHDRDLAERLIGTGTVDVLMHRYNMAHRKSEGAVLPAAEAVEIPVVAFTCTRWASLLKGHRAWSGETPTAVDCYRFALSNPAVQVALSAPGNLRELEENIGALNQGPMSEADRGAWCSYGDLIYGDGTDAFETRWP